MLVRNILRPLNLHPMNLRLMKLRRADWTWYR